MNNEITFRRETGSNCFFTLNLDNKSIISVPKVKPKVKTWIHHWVKKSFFQLALFALLHTGVVYFIYLFKILDNMFTKT